MMVIKVATAELRMSARTCLPKNRLKEGISPQHSILPHYNTTKRRRDGYQYQVLSILCCELHEILN